MQLADARKGDRYRVRNGRPYAGGFKSYEARIVRLGLSLFVVVDYNVIGPVDDIPEPWASFRWEKVQ